MKILDSRYPGFCRACRRKFPVGTRIEWDQASGSKHQGACPPCTGCSAQTGHDAQCSQTEQLKGPVYHTKAYFASKPVVPQNPNWRDEKYGPLSGLKLNEVEVGGRGRSYFAVPFDGEGQFEGHLFVRIDRPAADSRWSGNVFVKWVYGPNEKAIGRQFADEPSYRNLREFGDRFDYPLNELWADSEKAKAKYGQIIGKCGHCGKRLTDATSRERGIGPDCWEMTKRWRKSA